MRWWLTSGDVALPGLAARTLCLALSNAYALAGCRASLRDSKPEPVKALEAEEQAKIESGELKPSVGGMKPGWEPKRTIAITHDNSR